MSDDALLEEYSVARATFDLSMTDMMEIARNSILQSGFEEEFKQRYLGKDYRKGATFCDEVSFPFFVQRFTKCTFLKMFSSST